MHPDDAVLCLVTDRSRLDAGSGFDALRRRMADLARDAAEAGLDLIQVRERGLETAQLVDLVGGMIDASRATPTRVIVNDRLDVALAAGAAGVHLRGDSITPAAVRPMIPSGFLVGRSVRDAGEAREHASAADYLIAGTMRPTASKPSGPWLGEDGLAAIVRAVRVPVLAIGGMTVESAAQAARAGAAGIAAIQLFLPEHGPLSRTVPALRAAFDSARAAS